MGIKVLKPGFMTTIQDIGRYGFEKYGISRSGVMDSFSYRLANLLVGNFNNEAVLEITMIGPTLQFQRECIISICGADLSPQINQCLIPMGKPLAIKKGDILRFRKMSSGIRSYLAVHGGIRVKDVFYSKSTDLKAKLGGLFGRAIKQDDIFPIKSSSLSVNVRWGISPSYLHSYKERRFVRFIKGVQYDWFTVQSKYNFTNSPYKIQSNSDRMGYRTLGTPLILKTHQELITEGVTFGSVQVPPDGNPIILMADRQTTGGYPKIAQIASIDLPLLAQKRPGEELHFKEITIEHAHELSLARERELLILRRFISEKLKGAIKDV